MTQYTGHVEPHGAPATRTLDHLIITKMSVGEYDNNTYLLTDRSSGEALLIDAAAEGDRILDLVAAGPRAIQAIVTTHQHGDHWQGLKQVSAATGASLLTHSLDAGALPVASSVFPEQGSTYAIGSSTVEFIHLRGHTPGSIAVLYRDPSGHPHLFTGDSLFPGGPGRTTSPADFDALLGDLTTRVFEVLPDDTWVYPGHGDDTTLGAERPHLGKWRARGW